MLKNIGARTEPCGSPFLMVYVFDVSLSACGLKLRFVISFCTNRTMHLLRIILVSKAASVSSVSLTTCSTVLFCSATVLLGRNPACSCGRCGLEADDCRSVAREVYSQPIVAYRTIAGSFI